MARSFQITNLFFDLTVLNNLQLACQFIEDRKRLFQQLSNSHRAHGRANELLESFELEEKRDSLAGELSHGEQRRLEIAVTMASKPDLLLLDEPTSGLDPNQIIEIRNVIREQGQVKTVLFSSHILQEVEAICASALILSKGQIVANDYLYNLLSNKNPTLESVFKTLTSGSKTPINA